VQELSAVEHLKIAKRLHFQGQTEEAIKEYELVLEIDPNNEDALAGLDALGAEPPTPKAHVNDSSVIKTNFYTNQAKESNIPAWRRGPVKVIVAALGIITAYGIYQLVIMGMNWDSIVALKNVDVQFQKPVQKEDGSATVSVEIDNFNPGPIKDVVISYNISDEKGNGLKEGHITIHPQIPAGDKRIFENVDLGTINGRAGKMQAKGESLVYKKPKKLKETMVDKFIDASMKADKDTFNDFDELTNETENFAPAFVGMGRAYAARGDYKRAIKEYQRAIEIDPEDANAYNLMAVAYFYNNQKDEAKKAMNMALQLAPEDPEIDHNQKYLINIKESKPAEGKKK
jgi:tetratricopeptide (TPR) repeat protein